jgi:hypothetical protein
MRKLSLITASLLVTTTLSGIANAAPPVPPQSQAVQLESGPVHFTVLTVKGAGAEDRTAFLDQILQAWGWPAKGTILLVLFPDANHDIRFAMGPGFRQNGLTVDEMLTIIRTQYLPMAHKGDPDGALAALMQTVSQRMGATAADPRLANAVTKSWTLLLQNDVKALAAMASDKMTGEPGVVIAPMDLELANPAIAGAALTEALGAMLKGSKPEVVAYRGMESQILLMVKGLNPVEITPTGGRPVRITDLVQIAFDRSADGSLKLLYVATDNGTFAEQIKNADWVVPESAPVWPAATPDRAATEFYTWYVTEVNAGRHPIPSGAYQSKVSQDPALLERVAKFQGADPFLCAQNTPKQVVVDSFSVFSRYALVTMKGGPWADGRWHAWQVKLVQEGGAWLINDVNCSVSH